MDTEERSAAQRESERDVSSSVSYSQSLAHSSTLTKTDKKYHCHVICCQLQVTVVLQPLADLDIFLTCFQKSLECDCERDWPIISLKKWRLGEGVLSCIARCAGADLCVNEDQ